MISKRERIEEIKEINAKAISDNAIFLREQHLWGTNNANRIRDAFSKELSSVATIGFGLMALIPPFMPPRGALETIMLISFPTSLFISIVVGWYRQSKEVGFWKEEARIAGIITGIWFAARSKIYNPNRNPVEVMNEASEKQELMDNEREREFPKLYMTMQIVFLVFGLLVEYIYYLIHIL